MSKPLSEDAILVAKALKNFDPEKYNYFKEVCCIAGQYYGWIGTCDWEKWWHLSDIAADMHGLYKVDYYNGYAVAAKLREVYELGAL